MKRIRHNGKTLLMITLAFGCMALALLWPQWHAELQALGYGCNSASEFECGGICCKIGVEECVSDFCRPVSCGTVDASCRGDSDCCEEFVCNFRGNCESPPSARGCCILKAVCIPAADKEYCDAVGGDFDPFDTSCNDIKRCELERRIDLLKAAEILSFTAEVRADATVTLAWETSIEIDNTGFNLYRTVDESGPYTRINGALIPTKGATGASYSFMDIPGRGSFRYLLEAVDTTGNKTMFGPIEVTVR